MLSLHQNIKLKIWILGFLFAFLIIWCLSFLFGNTVNTFTYSPDAASWIRPAGSIHRHRSEGWATSHFGQLDVIGVDDVSKNTLPAVVIWGDSHVEAFNVDQNSRMQQVLHEMLGGGRNMLTAFGVGMSGESVADYYFKIPRYEKKCPTIIAHYIIICSVTDALPDQVTAAHAVFQSKPELGIVDLQKVPDHVWLRSILRKYGMDFVWAAAVTVIKDIKLRFSLGPLKKGVTPAESDNKLVNHTASSIDAFKFLLHAMRQQTEKPITFVYCPYVPIIKNNRVDFEDHDVSMVAIFAKECQKNNIGFLDMTKEFCSYHRETGKFPRGFQNSRPSQGHFNRGGHRLIAQAIYKDFIFTNMRSHAFYTN